MTKQHFPLKYPVPFAGGTVTELHLRRPKGGDVRRANEMKGKSQISIGYQIMADLAEVDPALFDELDLEDIADINDWLVPLLDRLGLPAGSG